VRGFAKQSPKSGGQFADFEVNTWQAGKLAERVERVSVQHRSPLDKMCGKTADIQSGLKAICCQISARFLNLNEGCCQQNVFLLQIQPISVSEYWNE
jgi:hypothetical protein